MPLSDREREVLEQIERGLHESDPRLVAKLRDERSAPRRVSWLLVGVLALTGIGVLVLSVAVATQVGAVGAAVLGGGGFGIMVGALYLATRAYGSTGASGGSVPSSNAKAQRPAAGGKLSVMQKLEARWQRRFEERGR